MLQKFARDTQTRLKVLQRRIRRW